MVQILDIINRQKRIKAMSSITSYEILNAMKLGAKLRFRSKNHNNATRRLVIYGQKERRMDGLTYHTFIADYQKLLNNRAWYEPGNVFIIEWSWRVMTTDEAKEVLDAANVGSCYCGRNESCGVCTRSAATRIYHHKLQEQLKEAGCGTNWPHKPCNFSICRYCGYWPKTS